MNLEILYFKKGLSPLHESAVRDTEIQARTGTSRPNVMRAPFAGHRHRSRIVAIQDLDAVAPEYARFCSAVVRQAGVAIEVILGQVQHRSGIGLEPPSGLELVAGKLEHPDCRDGAESILFDRAESTAALCCRRLRSRRRRRAEDDGE